MQMNNLYSGFISQRKNPYSALQNKSYMLLIIKCMLLEYPVILLKHQIV